MFIKKYFALLKIIPFCLFFYLFLFSAGYGYARNSEKAESKGKLSKQWIELTNRLIADGLDKEYVYNIFKATENSFNSNPMGTKVKELYRSKFMKTPLSPGTAPVQKVYKSVLTEANLKKAQAFLKEHKNLLNKAHKAYNIPPEIIVGLLLVETRLGTYLGIENALSVLASLAVSKDPELFFPYLEEYGADKSKKSWLQDVLNNKSEWAYSELKALLTYGQKYQIDITNMPGSIYGAVGICQFMPSNILLFGIDGNGNGNVNLFILPDAIHSLSNYLQQHGWNQNLSREKQKKVLKKYNNSNTYANTILAVADYLKKANKNN